MTQALVNSVPNINQIALRLRNQSLELSDIEKKVLLLKTIRETFIDPVVTPVTEIVKGLASNPVTGVPLLAASSEYLYKFSPSFLRLRREIATLLLSPSAIIDTASIAIGGITTDISNAIFKKSDPADLNLPEAEFDGWLSVTDDIKTLESKQKTLLDRVLLTQERLTSTKESLGFALLGIGGEGIKDLERQLREYSIRHRKITEKLNSFKQSNALSLQTVKQITG